MKQSVVIWLMCASFLCAAQVEIVADKFFADEKKKVSIFEGHVKVTKESDKITANHITVEFDDKKQPIRYIAIGNAKANLIMNQKKYYGEAEKMTYEPQKSLYILEKKAFLHEIDTDKKVYGDYVRVDQNSGHYSVDGKGGEPVKFIFKVEDKKE
ncbi:lipopolysaccharide transport periplasmic protein LptA [Sulfurospirillum barnesii]|uniref:Lipopolysaccharide transport periplasmic protein LptA n=1 Tax=Sulfurospirillum barnesii (strain ATCC 700032 / DSM 10660 / SES-3) TaxID=760154 RepID=I3XVQ1_SULBS|nr:lipopolysaccharide transport periplasmic protein LptA [Sulfurospirillum barnesii]AFL68025.1 lipopolysaccharide transport periplasmic protein LptA [Sulfurospirillum barnesii SES-3]